MREAEQEIMETGCLTLRIITEEDIMSGTYIIILVQSCHWNGPINILAVIPTVTVKSLFSTCAAIGLEMVPQQQPFQKTPFNAGGMTAIMI